jgi:hypothetical protein
VFFYNKTVLRGFAAEDGIDSAILLLKEELPNKFGKDSCTEYIGDSTRL